MKILIYVKYATSVIREKIEQSCSDIQVYQPVGFGKILKKHGAHGKENKPSVRIC